MPQELLGAILLVLALDGFVAWFAQSRGHSAVEAFALSLMLSPVFGFLIYVLREPKKPPAVTASDAPRKGAWAACERCGLSRAGQDRYCSRCGLDYWSVPPTA